MQELIELNEEAETPLMVSEKLQEAHLGTTSRWVMTGENSPQTQRISAKLHPWGYKTRPAGGKC